MSLADFYGESKFFKPGKHRMRVKSVRFFEYNSGSQGAEFACGNGKQDGKIAFCLVNTALWKLANFAEACGIGVADMRKIMPENAKTFQVFVGREFTGVVEKNNGGYSEIVDFEAVDSPNCPPPSTRTTEPDATESKPAERKKKPEPVPETVPPSDDEPPLTDADIPF